MIDIVYLIHVISAKSYGCYSVLKKSLIKEAHVFGRNSSGFYVLLLNFSYKTTVDSLRSSIIAVNQNILGLGVHVVVKGQYWLIFWILIFHLINRKGKN